MPRPNRCWWHVMWNTQSTWLHGSPRGFRSRHHRIHSSGDYKHPPPPGEHEGLYRYQKARSAPPVRLDTFDLRKRVGRSLVRHLLSDGWRVAVLTVCRTHVHVLAELPVDLPEFRKVVGRCKLTSSRAVKDALPGSIWGRGEKHVLVRSRAQQEEEFDYVRNRQERGAWSWCFREDVPDEEAVAPRTGRSRAGDSRKKDARKQDPRLRSERLPPSCATPRRSAAKRSAAADRLHEDQRPPSR